VPNFIKIGLAVAKLSQFFHSLKMAAGGHFEFLNSGNLNSWQRPEGRDASSCQISSKSVKWLLRNHKKQFAKTRFVPPNESIDDVRNRQQLKPAVYFT